MFRNMLVVLATAAALPAAAQDLVTAADPDSVLEVAKGFGSAELDTDGQGDPLIRGRIEGRQYSVYFYGCENNANCTTLQFWTYIPKTETLTLDAVNEWNSNKRFSTAFIDKDGDVGITYDVNLYGGVSQTNLDDTFDWWRVIMQGAQEVFAEGAPAGGTTSEPSGGDTAEPSGGETSGPPKSIRVPSLQRL